MTARDAEPTKAVIDGVLQYVSPSQITTADPQSYGGCFRRWWFEKVGGKKQAPTKANDIGTRVHAEFEHTLTTGEDVRGPIARLATPWMPPGPWPRDTLRIEQPIAWVHPDGSVVGTLKIADLPVLGYIDVVDLAQPVPRIIDWKTTSKLENAKKAHELPEAVQMMAYAGWAFTVMSKLEQVEVGHVTMGTKVNDAVAAFVTIDRETTSRRLRLAEPVVATIRDLARETDPARAPANPTACGAYGGCPHLTYCPRTAADTLASIVGRTAAMSLTQAITPPAGVGVTINALAAAAVPQYPPGVDPAFADAIATIEAVGRTLNMGFPAVGGAAAAQYAQLRGLAPAAGFAGYAPPGSGDSFAGLTITDVQQAIKMADSMSTHFKVPAVRWGGAPAAAPAPVAPPAPPAWAVPPTPPAAPAPQPAIAAALPPDAPPSNPALAALPVEGWAPPGPAPAARYPNADFGPAPAAPTPPGPVAAPPPEQPRRRGRPPKAKPVAAALDAAGSPPMHVFAERAQATGQPTVGEVFREALQETPPDERLRFAPADDSADLELWVDCMPAGDALLPFAPVVARLVDTIHSAFKVEDMRSAPADGPLGYGRWKGILASMTREAVAKGTIAAVGYYADSRGDFAAVVIEALEKHVVARGVR